MCQGQKSSKGATVAGTLRTWVQGYVRAHRSHPAPPNFKPPVKLRRLRRSPEADLGQRLASESQVLQRLVAVQPHTIAVVLPSDQPPQIKRPGEQLRPSLLSGRKPSYVVVISTAVTRLDVTMRDLATLDENIPLVKIRVGVQVNDHDGYAALMAAAQVNHTDLDGYLIERVKRELDEKVRRAVKWNGATNLRSKALDEILTGDALPHSFADGILVQRGVTVLETVWPDPASGSPHSAPVSPDAVFRRPESEWPTDSPQSALNLTSDAHLREVWNHNAELGLLGIAGAQDGGGSTTVIAVPTREPATHEETQLREAFGAYYQNRRVRLVSAVADTYDEIVRAWFKKVDSWPRRLVAVTGADTSTVLRIHVDQSRLSADERSAGVWVGQESDREALRLLLPYRRIEFVSADAG